MPVEDRQSMIVDAVIPLLLKHGASITSREIAEEAGIAEGTIFRAFGDKDSLINAAIEKYFDPAPMREQLREIDPGAPLGEKVASVIEILQKRFVGVFGMMAALGHAGRPHFPHSSAGVEYTSVVAELVRPDLECLNLPPDKVGPLLRLVAFSASLPPLNETVAFTLDELTDIVLYGIAGTKPSPTANDN